MGGRESIQVHRSKRACEQMLKGCRSKDGVGPDGRKERGVWQACGQIPFFVLASSNNISTSHTHKCPACGEVDHISTWQRRLA